MVLLFDLDGTLADTERLALEVTDAYFRRQGREIPPDDLTVLVGRTWTSALEFLAARYPLGKTEAVIVDELLAEYRLALARGVPEIPGSRAAIRELAAHFRLGVVSGSHRGDIETVLQALEVREHFESLVGFEDYTQSKPSPAPYLEMLRRLGARPEQVLVFEDSENGVRSAHAAGLDVVAVGNEGYAARTRPTTRWQIDDFSGVSAGWVRARFQEQAAAPPVPPPGAG